METKIAKIISWLFHPLLLPTAAVVVLLNLESFLNYTISPSGKLAAYAIVFINTGIVPALLAYFHYRFGMIKSLQMETKEERVFPFLISAFFYFFCFYVLKKNHLPAIVCLTMFGAAVAVTIVFLINFFWKISVHSTAAGGILGMLYGVSDKIDVVPVFIFFVVVSGLVIFSRLKLKAHTSAQVYAGFVLGFFSIAAIIDLFGS